MRISPSMTIQVSERNRISNSFPKIPSRLSPPLTVMRVSPYSRRPSMPSAISRAVPRHSIKMPPSFLGKTLLASLRRLFFLPFSIISSPATQVYFTVGDFMKRFSLLYTLFPIAFFLFLLFFPAVAGEAVLSRTVFFITKVFPTLFPALCLSGMLVASPMAKRLYRFPFGVEGTLLLLGVLCGFPVGARSAMQLYEVGKITKRRAEFLCGFSNLASAPFLLGVVGNSLFESPALGWRFLALQTVCALLTAGVLYLCLRPPCPGITEDGRREAPLLSHITAATRTVAEVGGMLIFFGTAGVCAGSLLRLSGIPAVLLSSLFEFSAGCNQASALGGRAGELLAALSVGFSGLCVLGQVAAVTKGKLSLLPYLGGKVIQTALMGVLFFLFA